MLDATCPQGPTVQAGPTEAPTAKAPVQSGQKGDKMHYIGMAGLSGYLPQCTVTGPTRTSVAEQLAFIHERGQNWTKALIRDWYADLRLPIDGNEYAEIVECNCETPEIHEDC